MGRPTMRALRSTAERPVQALGGMSRELQAIQDSIRTATKDARQEPFTRGRALRVYFDGNTTAPAFPQTKTISHGLGRKPVGVVARKFYSGEAMGVGTGALTTRLVTLTASASGTVEFWVY